MANVIETKNLTKHFGKVEAVSDVSLSVRKGEIYGFLGLNGAGKTTTIRMLLGMIKPTLGEIFLNGNKLHFGKQGPWDKIGYMVETPNSYPELTVRENLEVTRRLRRISDKGSVQKVIDKLTLNSYSARKTAHLSLGNAQRLGIAKALIHNPEMLLLDEPANGLDPAGIVEMRDLLRNLVLNDSVTIFISSHILGEISKIATRIGIIHNGRLIQEVNADSLETLLHRRLLLNAVDRDGARKKLIEKGFAVRSLQEGTLEINDENAINHPEEIADYLVRSGFPPTMLMVEQEDLESYFLRITGMSKGKEK